jgi:hypothetical protein
MDLTRILTNLSLQNALKVANFNADTGRCWPVEVS